LNNLIHPTGFIKYKRPVHINIILANTLLAPIGEESMFGNEFAIQVDKRKYLLNTQVLDDPDLFDVALELCDDLADNTLHIRKEIPDKFENILKRRYPKGGFNGNVTNSFFKIYEAFKEVKEKKRDSIWKFILQNFYKPYFLQETFDYIIGNPPWFTYSSIKNEEYQNILNELAEQYNVKPERVANFPNLEIAAIFLSYCSSYFLKENGRLAFVVPRSFFSADHHDNTRSGKAKGFRLTNIWDLNGVSPLFRIPSGALFAEKAKLLKKNKQEEPIKWKELPATGLDGEIISGKLPAHNCNLKEATPKLSEEKVKWFYVKQGKSSAFSTRKTKKQTKVNPYKDGFKRGAEITPRNFYFVELDQEMPPDFEARILHLKTTPAVQAEAKAPWKGFDLSGQIESRYLFKTALAKSILPFALYKPDFVVLPIHILKSDSGSKTIKLLNQIEIRREGYLKASSWFMNGESIWNVHKTERNKKITAIDYLNWNNKLVSQNLNAPYLVLYNASAKDANATVVKRSDLDFEFIVDTKAYAFCTSSEYEAYYLTAILNSSLPNLMMKDFQTKGLFGARDVHKKILDIYYPKFDENDKAHIRIAELGKEAHEKTAEYLNKNVPREELTAMRLGKLRTDIKKHLVNEMKEIDKIVKGLIQQ
jgi:hypothetical protein